jgi:hypothetical protein
MPPPPVNVETFCTKLTRKNVVEPPPETTIPPPLGALPRINRKPPIVTFSLAEIFKTRLTLWASTVMFRLPA